MVRTTNKTIVKLSEQDLIDCSSTDQYKNQGCGGGNPENAFSYVKKEGIVSDKDYPYEYMYKPKVRIVLIIIYTDIKLIIDQPTKVVHT